MSWFVAYRYPTIELAGPDYRKVMEIIRKGGIDASVWRIALFGTQPHIVIGVEGDCDEDVKKRFDQLCSDGRASQLPDEARELLWERRMKNKRGASWSFREQQHRPGLIL